jgi:hypothetical protein
MTADHGSEDRAWRVYRRRRLYLRSGQVLMLIGALIAVVHWLGHLGPASIMHPPLWLDLSVNYPVAAVLIIIGANLSAHKPK